VLPHDSRLLSNRREAAHAAATRSPAPHRNSAVKVKITKDSDGDQITKTTMQKKQKKQKQEEMETISKTKGGIKWTKRPLAARGSLYGASWLGPHR